MRADTRRRGGVTASRAASASRGAMAAETPSATGESSGVSDASTACGAAHCLRIEAGKVFSWKTATHGDRFGQCGWGKCIQVPSQPLFEQHQVALPPEAREPVRVAASDSHSAVVDSSGEIWLFGCDRWLQLGQATIWKGGSVWRNSPVRLGKPVACSRFVDAALGEDHTLALCEDGNVWAWGRGEHGQLFGEAKRPFTSPPVLSAVLSGKTVGIGAAQHCSCRQRADGVQTCVGSCSTRVKEFAQAAAAVSGARNFHGSKL
eukprot:6174854-Pleurochrysis_carterae.AAC.1